MYQHMLVCLKYTTQLSVGLLQVLLFNNAVSVLVNAAKRLLDGTYELTRPQKIKGSITSSQLNV